MTTADLHWLAGWLEGEGHFRARVDMKRGKIYPRFEISAYSVDHDIIQRASNLAGYACGPYAPKGSSKQAHWIWQETHRDSVLNLCAALYPLMGERRKIQIDSVLAVANAYPAKRQSAKIFARKGEFA